MNVTTTKPRIGRGGVSRHLALLKNADVDRWNRNLKAGSEKTAKVWLAAVGRFMEWASLTPEALLSKTGDEATRLLEDYRDTFQKKSSGTEGRSRLHPRGKTEHFQHNPYLPPR